MFSQLDLTPAPRGVFVKLSKTPCELRKMAERRSQASVRGKAFKFKLKATKTLNVFVLHPQLAIA